MNQQSSVSSGSSRQGFHAVTWLRHVAMAEGVSYLLLLGIAMPLKYLADWPWGVKYVGWAHGVLFISLMAMILLALIRTRLTIMWAIFTFIASLLPFGPFVIDHKLKQFES